MDKKRAIPEGYMTVGELVERWGPPCGPCSITTERACSRHHQRVREAGGFIRIRT